jgi:hypothetical protein
MSSGLDKRGIGIALFIAALGTGCRAAPSTAISWIGESVSACSEDLALPHDDLASRSAGREEPEGDAYRFVREGEAVIARNPVHGFEASFTRGGVRVAARRGPELALRTARIGCSDASTALSSAPPEPSEDGERVSFRHAAFGAEFVEWYENGPFGLEQGYTLGAAPCRGGGRGIAVEIALGGELDPATGAHDETVILSDRSGDPAFRIGGLHVEDASGRALAAHFEARGDAISIRVDDERAVYPVFIDPTIVPLKTKLLPPDPAPGAGFASAVSLSQHTAIVGAPGAGLAHVFFEEQGAWSAQATLAPAAPSPGFGTSVAVWADTALVGAPGDGGTAGAVHVFVRKEEAWSEEAVLAPADGALGDSFGASVALSGDTAVIGAPHADGAGVGSGAAYVFTRSLGVWTQRAKLAAAGGQTGDAFGASVAVFRDRALVGAPHADGAAPGSGVAYVFAETNGLWSEEAKLAPGDGAGMDELGAAVGLWEDTALVGASGHGSTGAAYSYVRGQLGWMFDGKLTPPAASVAGFGASLAVAGNNVIVGSKSGGGPAPGGAAFLFKPDEQGWKFRKKLADGDPAGVDGYGVPVAVTEHRAVVGAREDAEAAPGTGAAFAYRLGTSALAAAELTCSSSTTLNSLVSCIRNQMPRRDTEGYSAPSATAQTDVRTVVSNMLNGRCDFSLPASLSTTMRLRPFTDGDNRKVYCVLMEVDDRDADGYVDRGWGTFIVDPAASRELSQQAPHPLWDDSTDSQAVDIFKGTSSRSFLMCGAHRYANAAASACDAEYKSADCAHETANLYHPASLEIDAFYGARAHSQLQWHGMGDTTCATIDAYASHGLATAPPQGSNVLALEANAEASNVDWIVAVPGSGTCTLNGTDNVQGRFLNGVATAGVCTTAATASTGRFVHIEQHAAVRVAASWIAPVANTFPIPQPTAPTSLAATAGNAQVSLSWSPTNGASGYRVLRGTTSGGPYTSMATGVLTTNYLDTGLTNGVTYRYIVRAQNALGESAASNEAQAAPSVTAPAAPAAPTSLVATAGRRKITLTWTASTGAVSYRVKRTSTSGSTPYTIATGVTATTYTDSLLPLGATFWYVVTAVNASGESAPSNTASTTVK